MSSSTSGGKRPGRPPPAPPVWPRPRARSVLQRLGRPAFGYGVLYVPCLPNVPVALASCGGGLRGASYPGKFSGVVGPALGVSCPEQLPVGNRTGGGQRERPGHVLEGLGGTSRSCTGPRRTGLGVLGPRVRPQGRTDQRRNVGQANGGPRSSWRVSGVSLGVSLKASTVDGPDRGLGVRVRLRPVLGVLAASAQVDGLARRRGPGVGPRLPPLPSRPTSKA